MSMGCEQASIETYLTEHIKECQKTESKVAGNSRGKLSFISVTTKRVTIKSIDRYKNEEFVMVGKHPEPNVYHIKPVNGNGPEWIVNQQPTSRSWKNPK